MPSVARNFVGASSTKVTCSLGAVALFGPGTAAAVCRFGNTNFNAILSAGNVGAGWEFGTDNAAPGHLQLYNGAATVTSTFTVSTSVWYFIAVTKSSGSTTPRFHLFRYDTQAWTHTDAGSTLANSGTPATNIWLGASTNGTGDLLTGDIQVAGFWNSVLTDAQIEALAPSTLAWAQSYPTVWYDLCQAAITTTVVDRSGGGANETAHTLTTVTTGNPFFDQPPMVVPQPVVPHTGSGIILPFPLGVGEASPPALIADAGGVVPADLGTLQADCVSTATLFVTAETDFTLSQANAVSTATLALTAPTKVVLGQADAVSTATLTVFTPKIVPLDPAAAQSSATLALTAPALLSLTSAGVSSATLALSAQTTIPLGTSAAVSSATLALTAQTYITLATSAAQSSATLNLAQYVPLATAAAQSSATLALTAPAKLTLATSAAQSSATLTLTAATRVTLATSAALSTATLFLTAQTYITLGNAAAVSTATLTNFTSGTPIIPMSSAAAVSTATLTLVAQTYLVLTTAAGLSTATLDLTAPFVGGGGVGLEMPVLLLMLDDDD